MKPGSGFRLRLLGAALGVAVALLLWPASRWLVTAQAARLLFWQPGAWSTTDIGGYRLFQEGQAIERMHSTAVARPDDFQIAVADALATWPGDKDSSDKLARVRALESRFPDQPAVYAHALRIATIGKIILRRPEEAELVPQSPGDPPLTPRPSDPDAEAAFDQDAAAGERLAPDNGFFPAMRAIGLFKQNRDTEALAALHRSALCTAWNDYLDDDLFGEWRLQEETFGKTGALPRIGAAARMLLPHYAQLRGLVRVSVAAAIRAEQSGDMNRGIGIRDDVLRCGGAVRASSGSLLGSLVGAACCQTALQRPGGAPLIKSHDKARTADGAERALLLARYDAFLRRAGHTEYGARAHAEMEAWLNLKAITSHLPERGMFGSGLWKLGMLWWCGVDLLISMIWLLLIGAGAAALNRLKLVRSGAGTPPWFARSAALGGAATLLSAIFLVPAATPPAALWLRVIAFFGAAALALPAKSVAARLRALLVYLGALALSVGGVLLFAWQVMATSEPFRKMVLFLWNLSSGAGGSEDRGFALFGRGNQEADLLFHLLSVVAAAAAPLIAATTFFLVSRYSKVPASVAMVRGFRGCAVPIVSVMVLVYAALTMATMRLEADMEWDLQQSVHGEGRYIAALEHTTWPERVP